MPPGRLDGNLEKVVKKILFKFRDFFVVCGGRFYSALCGLFQKKQKKVLTSHHRL